MAPDILNPTGLQFLHRCGLTPEEFSEAIRLNSCPPHLVLGIVKTESSGDAGAMRFEPHYTYLFKVPEYAKQNGWTKDTEKTLQMFSYGLMQIMLATARWRGFNLHPKVLLDPKHNVAWGCFHLGLLFSKYGSWEDSVAAYNYGHPAKKLMTRKYKNQEYVDRVYRYAGEFKLSDEPKIG